MRNLKAVALLFFIAVLSVCTVIYGGVTAAFSGITVVPSDVPSETTGEQSEETDSAAETAQTSEPSQSSAQSNTDSAVPVREGETVSGKIISKFISPYGASKAGEKVYVKNSTGTKIDLAAELATAPSLKIKKSQEPQVLIFHTHTTESYMLEERDYYTTNDSTRSTAETENMVRVGNAIESKLTAAGYGVLHDKTMHDYPSYTGSYSRSEKTVKACLAAHPSIKIVIDVHRDAVSAGNSDKVKTVTEINGRKAAQVMLVMGSETGGITGFPNWRENLRLALRLQQSLETLYPGLARSVLLLSKKYNENLTPGSMLIEIGTDGNTINEAEYSGELVGNALCALLPSLE